jgi:uncharacterized lipoprotein
MRMKKLIAIVAALLLLAGCTPESGKKQTVPADKVMEQSLEALVTGEGDTMILASDGTAVAMGKPTGIAGVISGQLRYDVESVEVDGEKAEAEIEITAPDTVKLVQKALEGMTTFDEATFLLKMKQLAAEEPETVTFSLTVDMVLAENGWCIVPDNEFSNAITGGLANEYTAVRQAFLEALAKEGGEG